MLTTDREFHYLGELNISQSKMLESNLNPQNDEINWLFLVLDESYRYSFVYKIMDNQSVSYNSPFKILLAFTFYDFVENEIQIGQQYSVQRGEEYIGKVKIVKRLLTNESV
ncbi:hypothetical protein AR438_17120 [Chryseobacterium aquaticum]|uniref:Uncharacterized protein n=1 Tax=Chryseobacterium aquaticum TaxID=452084 RepID=A0A0Q3P2U3_9FLAO|nr:hypothetical protein [Chryseobacterium aquaticum]KQK24350.1 hypothetical protein AR438_17120 [Chryseobacterium aquaticum]